MCFDYYKCPSNNSYRQYIDTSILAASPGVTGVPQLMAPVGPPPPFIPSKIEAIYESMGGGSGFFFTVDPSTFSTCMFMYVYVWLRDGTGFWSWINYVDMSSIAGWRWNGSSWVPFRLNINNALGFGCF